MLLSLQSCPTLCDPIDGSPPGSPIPGILQAITLEWVAISFSNAWKWKVKVKSPQPSRLLHPWDFPGKSTGVGCHCLLCNSHIGIDKSVYCNLFQSVNARSSILSSERSETMILLSCDFLSFCQLFWLSQIFHTHKSWQNFTCDN